MATVKKFINISRARTAPAETAKSMLSKHGIEYFQPSGDNRLEVSNSEEESHIYLSGSVGGSWWDDSGITEKEFRDSLNSTKKGKPVHVHINSEGGSVQEGLGIYNAIKERSSDITCHVDGYALSIASVIPLAAGKVISPKSAIWMIHNAWSWASGNADDMEKQATMLREHDAMLSEIIADATGKTIDSIRADMKAETWVRGSQAVEYGLADEGEPDEADEPKAGSYRPLPQAWLDRCANMPENILNALRPKPSVRPAEDAGVISSCTTPKESETAAAEAGGNTNTQHEIVMPENTTPAAVQPTASDALAEIKALKEQIITNRVQEYVRAQKITKAEVPIFVKSALADEKGTFEILDAKTAATTASEPVAGNVFTIGEPPKEGGAVARYAPLQGKTAKARFDALKQDWSALITDALRQDDIRNEPLRKMGAMPANSNTYSSTLVTAFLTDGATTVLQNKWAPLRAFCRDFSTDPYKPNAVAQHKYVSAGPTVQTDATNFESGDSTVAPITITPHQYTSSINVSNADLNNGLRMENLMTITVAKLANKVIEVALAPVTLANFAAATAAGGSGNVITAANFTFTDMSRIWGVLQKANQRFAILDGAYYAKLLLQPTYFQAVANGTDESALKAYGWDGIFVNSDWTGASNNAAAFFCDPQAIAALMGLPLTPPAGIPGNTLQQGEFTIPGVEASVQTNSWFNLASRTAWMSYDVIAGFSAMDGTAGAIVATS